MGHWRSRVTVVFLLAIASSAGRAATISTTWDPGDGDYEDPSRWIFSEPPSTAAVPNNDAIDSFNVSIDGSRFSGPTSTVRLSSAVELDSLRVSFGDTLVLDGGSALAEFVTISSGSALEGQGEIGVLPSGFFRVDGTISPGIDGLGVIDVPSDMILGGVIDAEIGGAGPEELDRIRVAGTADLSFSGPSRAVVRLVDDFAPRLGDTFDLLEAASIPDPGNPDILATVPDLGPDLFLVAAIESEPTGDFLRLRTKTRATGDWIGNAGSFGDAASWRIDPALPPGSSGIPDEDDLHLFTARIATGDADVALADEVALDRLEIGTGDTLRIDGGGRLEIRGSELRTGSRTVANDGVLTIGAAGPGELAFIEDGRLEGSGELLLGAEGQIGRAPSGRLILTNGEGHTIRGGGRIDLGTRGLLVNEGRLVADAATALEVTDSIDNFGEIRIDGGTLVAGDSIINRGSIVGTGGTFEMALGAGNQGTIDLSGVAVTMGTPISNSGLLDVRDGTTGVQFSHQSDAASTTIRGGAEAAASVIRQGTIRVDGGVLRGSPANFGLLRLETMRLEALGEIDADRGSLDDSVLAIGGSDTGLLTTRGSLRIADSILETQLRATDDHDQIRNLGTLDLRTGIRFQVELLDGFLPSAGDVFDLIVSDSPIPLATSPSSLVDAPDLDPGLALVAGLDATQQRLLLRALELRTATWTGGTGSYGDAARWTFDAPLAPGAGAIPTRDDVHFYRARIDGGSAGASTVSLGAAVELQVLLVSDGDTLSILDGGGLTIGGTVSTGRAPSIRNDGTVRLSGPTAHLRLDDGVEITGAGELILDGAGEAIGTVGDQTITVAQRAGHTIRGEGTIDFGPPGSFVAGRLVNEGTVLADRPEGTLRLTSNLVNHGLARASDGATLDVGFGINEATGRFEAVSGGVITMPVLENRGTTLVSGAGSRLELGRYSGFGGELRAENGGVIDFGNSDFFNNGLITLSSGGVLRARTAGSFGRIRMDAGRMETLGGTRLDGTRVEGNGTFSVGFPGLLVHFGTVSPGLDGIGRLDVEGDLAFGFPFDPSEIDFDPGGYGTILEVDVGDFAAGEVDFISATGDVDFGGTIELQPLPGFAPVRGDAFAILEGRTISEGAPVARAVAAPFHASGLILGADIASGPTSETLVIRARELVEARWNGGDGSFSDPSGWTRPDAPGRAAVPANDAFDVYAATIGDAGSTGEISLDESIELDALEVGAGARLVLADGARLSLAMLTAADGVSLPNDGAIEIGASGALEALAGLRLDGAGEVVLGGPGSELIATGPLENTAAHTLRGSGRIVTSGRLENAGGIHAEGGSGLTIEGTVSSSGSITVTGGSALRVNGFEASLTNSGSVVVEGADSTLSVVDRLTNLGEMTVRDGGIARPRSLANREGAVLRVESGGAISTISSFIASGTIQLDDGRIDVGSTSSAVIGLSARVEGMGAISYRNFVRSFGTLAPGADGLGELSLEVSRLELQDESVIELQLGEAEGESESDLLTVLGTSVLAGTINISLLAGVTPEPGDSWDPLSAGTIEAADLAGVLALPNLPGNLAWLSEVVSLGERDVLRLTVTVPEPSAGLLLLVGLALTSGRRRETARRG